jgi:hypothetical protein
VARRGCAAPVLRFMRVQISPPALENIMSNAERNLHRVRALIRGWLQEQGEYNQQDEGSHILQYPYPAKDVYVVIAQKGGGRPRYIGWFAVVEEREGGRIIDNPQYDFCCKKDGILLYRAKHDRMAAIT